MAFWRLYYHLVWATKGREPLITATLEQELYGYIVGKADSLGCITHAINGTADHVHLVSSIPPKLSIATFVGQLKGSVCHHLNHYPALNLAVFEWQRGYGVFSLGHKQLEIAVEYVKRQKEHHQQGTIIPILERCEDED